MNGKFPFIVDLVVYFSIEEWGTFGLI